MVVVVIVVLSAIFVPMFWPYSYEEQDLRYANIPPELEIYDLGGNSFVYVTSDYKCIDTDGSGHLLGASTLVKDDKAGRTYLYEINGKDLLVDYGVYFRAKSEFITQEAAHGDGSPVTVAEVEYLRSTTGGRPETVSLREAEHPGGQDRPLPCVLRRGADHPRQNRPEQDLYLGHRLPGPRSVHPRGVRRPGLPAGGRGGRPGQPDRGRTLRRHCRLLRRRCGQHHDADCGHHQLHPHDALCHSHHGGAGLGPALNHSGHGPDLWVGMVRIVRSQVLTMREQEFVSAAVLLGVPTRKILVRHLIPNAMGPIMVALTMQIPSAMFTEAFLSFIGLGISKPQASWGALANAALPSLYTSPYQLFYPALIMSITILALNLFSDGLRDSLDPRLRK